MQNASRGKESQKLFRPLLSRQARKDWRDHVTRQIDAVVEADAKSDSKAWWNAVHRIAGKSKRFNTTAPTADSMEELAARWAEYGESKFAASAREAARRRVTIASFCKHQMSRYSNKTYRRTRCQVFQDCPWKRI